jgi:hypothetical protein
MRSPTRRRAEWLARTSTAGEWILLGAFGGPDYRALPADYDGDGKADVAVHYAASGLWYVRRSSTGTDTVTGFGGSGYAPVN